MDISCDPESFSNLAFFEGLAFAPSAPWELSFVETSSPSDSFCDRFADFVRLYSAAFLAVSLSFQLPPLNVCFAARGASPMSKLIRRPSSAIFTMIVQAIGDGDSGFSSDFTWQRILFSFSIPSLSPRIALQGCISRGIIPRRLKYGQLPMRKTFGSLKESQQSIMHFSIILEPPKQVWL